MKAYATGITGLAASKRKNEADLVSCNNNNNNNNNNNSNDNSNSNNNGSGSNGSTTMNSGVVGHGGEYNEQNSPLRSMQSDHKDGGGFGSSTKVSSGSQQKALGSRPSMERFFSPLRKKPPLIGESVLLPARAFRGHS